MDRSANFFCIGAARCGTTWAWECLRHHPDVDVTVPKEVHFFTQHFDKGEEWYLRHFKAPDKPVRGEVNPDYLADPQAAARIASLYPEARLVAILREPRGRAVSHIQFRAQAALGDAAKSDKEQLQQFATREMIERSLYYQNLKPYLEAFGAERLTILYYDDLRARPERFQVDLYRAVGADTTFRYEDAGTVVNQGRAFRFPRLFKVLRAISSFFKRHTLLNRARDWFNRTFPLQRWLLEWLKKPQAPAVKLEFFDFYGPAEESLLRADLEELAQELKLELPARWLAERARRP